MKVCRKCEKRLRCDRFPANRKCRDGLSSWCRSCHATAIADWQRRHPERVREYNRRSCCNYRRRRPDVIRRLEYERRAKLKGGDSIDPRMIYERDRGRCHLCGRHVPPSEATLDHLVPVRDGGQHTASNVQLAHGRCNSARGARPLARI